MLDDPPSPWLTAEQLAESAPEIPDALVESLLIRGAITELSAKIKAGKTTFVGKMLKAMVAGQPFINLSTTCTEVLYLSEEGPNTFRNVLARSNLLDAGGHLHVLLKGRVSRVMPWLEVVTEIVAPKAIELRAGLVVVDTLSRWAGIKGDEENQAGAAAAAIEPLEMLRDAGMAVLTIHHDRKSDADIGDSSRGSSAWGGAGDILVRLTNPRTNGHPNRRMLESVGRFDDSIQWQIELDHGEYRFIGDGQQIERDRAKEFISSITQPFTKAEATALSGYSSSTISRAIAELIDGGQLFQIGGAGIKGSPAVYCYHL